MPGTLGRSWPACMWEEAKASVTFRVTSLLGIQQRWASLQRAPVAGVPYLLALSKSSLNGVLGNLRTSFQMC